MEEKELLDLIRYVFIFGFCKGYENRNKISEPHNVINAWEKYIIPEINCGNSYLGKYFLNLNKGEKSCILKGR